MNILSLFDGLSGFQIALKESNIKYDNYFASEIDKYAIKTCMENFLNTIQLGDVRNIKAENLPKINILVGGSPCQGFSFAGKQLNFNDERSKLFFEYVRILKEVKPDYFILENVLMKKEYQDVISKELGVEPIMINSSLLSAQNRKRLYWTNIKEGYFDLFGNKISFIPQPGDKNLVLKDILENGFVDRDKSLCLTSSTHNANLKDYQLKKQKQIVFNVNPSGFVMNGNIYNINSKSPTLTTNKGEGIKINSCKLVGLAADIKGNDSIKRIYSEDGKAPTLTAICGGNQEPKIYQKPHSFNAGKILENKAPSLTANSYQENNLLIDKNSYRKLTVRECARLQTIPEWFNFPVSNSQAYKMIGNGFTVEVLKYIISFLELEKMENKTG